MVLSVGRSTRERKRVLGVAETRVVRRMRGGVTRENIIE